MSDGSRVRAAYEEWHRRLEVDAAADAPWHLLFRQHVDKVHDLDGKRVLEIGSGRGGLSRWIADAAAPDLLVAEDFAKTAVSMGRTSAVMNGSSKLRWAVADVGAIPHPDRSFDTAVSCETIEHVRDPRRALRELHRCLRPGGHLYLTTPNYLSPMGLYRVYLRVLGRPYSEEGQPINHPLLLPRVVSWLRQTGFVTEQVHGVGHYLPFPGCAPIRLALLDRIPFGLKWLALHTLVIAVRRPA